MSQFGEKYAKRVEDRAKAREVKASEKENADEPSDETSED